MKTLKEMLDRRNAIGAELKKLEEKRTAEKRDFSAEETELIDKLLNERDELSTQIEAKQKEQNDQRAKKLQEALSGAGGTGGGIPRGPEPSTDERRDPVLNPDSRRYSLLRAIERRANNLPVDGYEGEISQEIAKRTGKSPSGFFMPFALRANPEAAERRDFDTTAGAGAIPNTLLTGRFIDILRNRPLLMQLGAQMMSDMVGTFDIPKQTGTGSSYWVTEGSPPTESAQTIGQVSFTPSTLGAFTDITRRFMKQTSLDGEQFVRNDLLRVIAIELDRAGFNGSGSGAEPQGILQNGSITTVALGANGLAPTWASVVALESAIAAANADAGTMAYVTSTVGRGKLKTVEKGSAGYPVYLWGDQNQMNGYRAAATNQIPSNLTKGSGTNLTAMIFGDFSTLMYAFWGGIDVLVDPYSNSTSGTVRVVALIDATLKILQAEKLAKIVDMIRT